MKHSLQLLNFVTKKKSFMNNSPYVSFSALDDLDDFYILVSDEGIILGANKTARENLAQSEDSITGLALYKILDPKSILSVEHEFNRSLSEKIKTQIGGHLRTKNNSAIEVVINFIPFAFESRRKVLLFAHDVTEERKREIELLRFYNVAENTANPLQITDITGKMVYVNNAFTKVSGYSKQELIGQNPSIFSSSKHPRKYWENMWQTISKGEVWVGEVENRKKNGEPFFTQLLVSPILNNEKRIIGYFGIHRDLTEKRNFEKQLVHTQKMESIGTLAAGVAHEVGNPLASISALVQIILRETKDEFIKEKLELVKKQITRISKIIRDLVDFSRPSNYELKLTDLNEIVHEAIEIVKVGKKAKDFEFEFSPDLTLPHFPLVADQIQQVFVNILINAADAIIEKKGIMNNEFIGKISVSTMKKDHHNEIILSDNGIGIKPENISKIFEPFFTTKSSGKGTGLGLWVSYGIIKSFQGDIKLQSKYSEGTTFTIILPTKSK